MGVFAETMLECLRAAAICGALFVAGLWLMVKIHGRS